MKIYIVSLAAGLLVGVIYSLMHVRSPAPPLVALVGLLGILGGERIVPLAMKLARPAHAAPSPPRDPAVKVPDKSPPRG